MPRIDRFVLLMVLLGFLLVPAAQAQQEDQAGEEAGQQQQSQQQEQQVNIDPTVAQPGGDLPGDPQIDLELIAEGLVDPVNVASAGDGRLFVVERVGRVRIVDESGELMEEPFLDIQDTVLTGFLEQGLLGLAFHPNFSENGRFYVNYTDYQTNGDQWIVEYQTSADDPNTADTESARVLLTIEEPYVNHNGGTIRFGPDGYLYIGVGDGGYAADTYETAQDRSDLLGSILRIDVDTQEGGRAYGIPDDNPFVPAGVRSRSNIDSPPHYHPNARPEIWAFGLRNPWQFTFDNETGDTYIADVGQNMWEEVNVVPGGGIEEAYNFGWDFMEASHCYPSETAGDEMQGDDCLVGILPVAEYNHEQGDCSITGMGIYRGEEFSELDGIYFTSDFCSGRIWGLAQDDQGSWQFEELMDTDLLVTGSGTSTDGDVYLTSCQCQFGRDYDPYANPSGQVWRVVAQGSAEGQTAGDGGGQQGDAEDDGTTDSQEGAAADDEATDEGAETDEGAVGDAAGEGEQAEGANQDGAAEGQDGAAGEQNQQEDQPEEQQDMEGDEQEQSQSNDESLGGDDLQALISQGDDIYHEASTPPCSSCHGASGGGGVGPALSGNASLEDEAFVAERILYGTAIMPPYASQLSNEEVAAVASYIRNSWQNDFGPVTPEMVEEQR